MSNVKCYFCGSDLWEADGSCRAIDCQSHKMEAIDWQKEIKDVDEDLMAADRKIEELEEEVCELKDKLLYAEDMAIAQEKRAGRLANWICRVHPNAVKILKGDNNG